MSYKYMYNGYNMVSDSQLFYGELDKIFFANKNLNLS